MAGRTNPKSEIRNPKEVRNPKSEGPRIPRISANDFCPRPKDKITLRLCVLASLGGRPQRKVAKSQTRKKDLSGIPNQHFIIISGNARKSRMTFFGFRHSPKKNAEEYDNEDE